MKNFKATTSWNEEAGIYDIILHTDMGDCHGRSVMHADDAKHKSEYFGGRLAEMRAIVVYFNRRANHERVEAKALMKYFNAMRGTRNFKHWEFWVSQLDKEIERKLLKAEEWKDKANRMKNLIKESIIARDAMFEAANDAKLKPKK